MMETAGSLSDLKTKTTADKTAKKEKGAGKVKTRSKDGGIEAVQYSTSPPSTVDNTVTSYDDDYDGEGGQAVATNTTVGRG